MLWNAKKENEIQCILSHCVELSGYKLGHLSHSHSIEWAIWRAFQFTRINGFLVYSLNIVLSEGKRVRKKKSPCVMLDVSYKCIEQ